MPLPENIKKWLNNRGITDEVIKNNNLDWNGTHIVIPIYDPAGNFLFNKYRRDPFGPEDLPKYKYDAGSSAQLFNAHKLGDQYTVIITEGELDTLALEARGHLAVSSTGGCGTFKDEWLPLLQGKDIYICYDNDDAGLKGAIKLLTKLPAKLILIPWGKGIKDVTDFLQNSDHTFTSLLLKAEAFPLLSEPATKFEYIKDIKEQVRKYDDYLNELKHQIKETSFSKHLEIIRDLIGSAIETLERDIRKRQYLRNATKSDASGRLTDEDIARAKDVPIEDLYSGRLRRVGYQSVGLCPFHTENHGSFVIYHNKNRWHCFGGCSEGGDSISFIQKSTNVDFIQAIKTLLHK